MQFWGIITVHPMTFPIADEVAHTAVMLSRVFGAVYSTMLQPTVEEIIIVIKYS